MIKLGYSLGESSPKYSIKNKIEILLSLEKDAVELGYVVADRLDKKLSEEEINNIKKFDYISIHAPAIISKDPKTWIRYPSKEGDIIIDKVLKIAKSLKADTILFHPDLIDDFKWINDKVGSFLAFENMDDKKPFGKTIEDMEGVFSKAPNAKWVCDVNHIYTMDRSMKLSKEFHNNFQDRLCHYHLSGYGGWHDALHISREDIILKGILDLDKPIINEGGALRDGEKLLVKEHEYILDRL